MAMEYVNYIKAKTNLAFAPKSEKPVLSDEDEKFLDRVITDENPPALPPRPDLLSASEIKDAQIALMDGAQNIPLPETPQETSEEVQLTTKATSETPAPPTKQSKSTWSWFSRDSRDTRREATATGLQDIAEGLKANKSEDVSEEVEAKKEEEEMTMMMEKLNLAAVNNRVFSISDETQELLQNFNQVLKDLMNGVPTAYHDLEHLLARGDKQLSETFSSLPSFLQKLIEKLPETMTKGIAPEVMAAAAQRATQAGINVAGAGKAAGTASKIAAQLRTPNLKELVGKPSAIANTMRTVLAYLRARFPAFMGMNVLWSLALFVTLLVFWYCYKRGREVRLEKERQLTDEEVQQLDVEYRAEYPNEKLTTTAADGAPIDEVKARMEATGTEETSAEPQTPSIPEPTS